VSEVRIAAEPRTEFGKGGARRTRRAGKVPAVLYGHGTDPRHISLPGHDLMLALKGGANTLLRLDLAGGGSELALPKSVQRDPVKGFLEHVDLVLVRRGEKVTVDVAVHLVGEAARDTIVDQQHTTVSVESEATHIPTGFEASIDGLDVGGHVTAAQLSLPSGVTLVTDPEQVVVTVLGAPTAEQLDAELAEAEADLGAGAAGAAAQAEPDVDTEPGTGDVVPDTDSAAGGPAASPSDTGTATGAATS